MADDFKTFDKAPIVGVVNISRWSFGIREIILAIIGVLLLILCLIFAGLFGHAENKLSDDVPSAAAVVGKAYCVDQGCLHTATRALRLMNTSINPCDNFYQYACGNYKNIRTPTSGRNSRSILADVQMENEDRVIDVIEKPISRKTDWAAERKLKEFFQSCNDMYQREKAVGTPFLNHVVSALGGWDLLGTWDEASWDFNTALKKVQSDFWIDALYGPLVGVDWYDTSHYALELSPSGKGKWMPWYMLTSTQPYAVKRQNDYKKFIRRVGSLLMRDAKLTSDPATQATKLDQFVNDTMAMETNIAVIERGSRYRFDPYKEVNKVSLRDLSSQTNNVIDWVAQFSYMFPNADVTGSTKVVLIKREYFQNMTAMISNLPDADRKRMLHNYLIWRVAEIYAQDLSWEYIHANREVYVDLNGRANFAGIYRYCFHLAERYMRDALGYLYIADHFSEDNRKHVNDVTDNLKKALQSQLDNSPWMDDTTKAYAKDKLDHVTFKMGYPDWMASHDMIDNLYTTLNVNASDFFGTLISANGLHRHKWGEYLLRGENRQDWTFPVYKTAISILWYWNEIIAPAGLLQNPVYDYRQPHFSTFGSLGTLLGRGLHHVVDQYGQRYDKRGDLMDGGSWWSNKSIEMYKTLSDCVIDVYSNLNETIVFPDGTSTYYPVNARVLAPIAISVTSGIKTAINGYRDWVAQRGISERMLPGIGLTDDQMLFLSYAQTHCYQRDPFETMINAYYGQLSEDLQVNTALGQLQEFSDAYGCSKSSQMYAPKKCSYH